MIVSEFGKMFPTLPPLPLLLPLLFMVLRVSGDAVAVYGKEGGTVELKPGAATPPITHIIWKFGKDLAIDWDGNEVTPYDPFAKRGQLDVSTGVMTLKDLVQSDSGEYTPEINHVSGSPLRLTVISTVPIPTITKVCEEDMSSCTLSCNGDTTGAEPVKYRWKSDDQEVKGFGTSFLQVDDSSMKSYMCELENPVSLERSLPFPNPLAGDGSEGPAKDLNIRTGVTVFICLLVPVILLVIVHRVKAGMWFFQKESMPWEGDFWRRDERPQRDAREPNGVTTKALNDEADG